MLIHQKNLREQEPKKIILMNL